MDHVLLGTPLYTDGNRACNGSEYIYDHGTVKYSVGRYVDGQIHLNEMYHHLSKKYLRQYVNQFCAKHNFRDFDTVHQMEHIAASAIGKRLMYRDPIK